MFGYILYLIIHDLSLAIESQSHLNYQFQPQRWESILSTALGFPRGGGCHWPLLHFGAGSLRFFPGVAATMGLAYFVSKKLILGKEQVRAGVDYPAQGVMWSCPCLGREL